MRIKETNFYVKLIIEYNIHDYSELFFSTILNCYLIVLNYNENTNQTLFLFLIGIEIK